MTKSTFYVEVLTFLGHNRILAFPIYLLTPAFVAQYPRGGVIRDTPRAGAK
jgi:hypothetical protein